MRCSPLNRALAYIGKVMSEKEISIKTDGITLKGDIVDVVAVPVATVCKTADNILQLVDNVVGLPADYLNYHLQTFRETYRSGFSKIPKNRRIEPTLRLGCNVLKNVAYAAEEPEVQKLFAQLLLSASDKETANEVHPSYASVISEMTTLDAQLLVSEFGLSLHHPEASDTQKQKSFSCLTRLGLLTWAEREYSENELSQFIGNNNYRPPSRLEDVPEILVDVINDLQDLKNTVIEDKRMSSRLYRKELVLTKYGESFINTVCKNVC